VIVHDVEEKLARIVLLHERRNGLTDRLRLVARRRNRDDARPLAQCRVFCQVIIERMQAPESAARKHEVNPEGERNDSKQWSLIRKELYVQI
jgi:hypothetical protein